MWSSNNNSNNNGSSSKHAARSTLETRFHFRRTKSPHHQPAASKDALSRAETHTGNVCTTACVCVNVLK